MHPRYTRTHPLTAGFCPHSDPQVFRVTSRSVQKQSPGVPSIWTDTSLVDLCPAVERPGHHIGLGCRNGYKPRSQIGRDGSGDRCGVKQCHHLQASLEVGLGPFPCMSVSSSGPGAQSVCQTICPSKRLQSFIVEPGKGLGTLSLGSCYSFHGTKLPNCF